MREIHTIPPVYDGQSEILILGSFPSVKSRETEFFYGHAKNRFWRVLADVYELPLPVTVEEKRALLHSCHIALWDVIASCDIENSSDSSIKNVTANDLSVILSHSPIKRICTNGKTAKKYYDRLIYPNIKIPAEELPSTSPANASWSLDRLLTRWKAALIQN